MKKLIIVAFLLVTSSVFAQQGPANGPSSGGGGTTITSGAGDFGSGTSQTGGVLTGQVNSVQSNATGSTVAAGDSSTKLATTAFVANVAAGINPAVAVQEATAAVLPQSPAYLNGASGIGATLISTSFSALVVDGVTAAVGDRILVKNQASALQNGVYIVTIAGSGASFYTLTRALDYDQPNDMNNTGTIPVVNGAANAGTSWLQTSQIVTVGTDAVTFAQFSYALSNQPIFTLTADETIPANTAVSVNAAGHAVAHWGPIPSIANTVTIAANAPVQTQPTNYFEGTTVLSNTSAVFSAVQGGGQPLQITPATISGSIITLGTADTTLAANFLQTIIPLSSTSFLAIYGDAAGTEFAVAATISGGVISYGTAQPLGGVADGSAFESGIVLTSTLAVVSLNDGISGNNVLYAIGISGTTVTVGTVTTVSTTGQKSSSLVPLSATAFAYAFDDTSNHVLALMIGTVSGTTITAGTPVDLSGPTKIQEVGIAAFDATHVAIVGASQLLSAALPNGPMSAAAASIVGTVPTFGAVVTVTPSSTFPQGASKFIQIGTLDSTHVAIAPNFCLPVIGTLSAGNTLAVSATSPIRYKGGLNIAETLLGIAAANIPNIATNLVYNSLTIQSASQFMIANGLAEIFSVSRSAGAVSVISPVIEHLETWGYYLKALDSTRVIATFYTWDGKFQARIVNSGAINATPPIGVTIAGASSGNLVTVQNAGKLIGLSGLTTGAAYYSNGDGSLVTANTGHQIGVALSTTELAISLN